MISSGVQRFVMIQLSLFHQSREHQPGPEIPGQFTDDTVKRAES